MCCGIRRRTRGPIRVATFVRARLLTQSPFAVDRDRLVESGGFGRMRLGRVRPADEQSRRAGRNLEHARLGPHDNPRSQNRKGRHKAARAPAVHRLGIRFIAMGAHAGGGNTGRCRPHLRRRHRLGGGAPDGNRQCDADQHGQRLSQQRSRHAAMMDETPHMTSRTAIVAGLLPIPWNEETASEVTAGRRLHHQMRQGPLRRRPYVARSASKPRQAATSRAGRKSGPRARKPLARSATKAGSSSRRRIRRASARVSPTGKYPP